MGSERPYLSSCLVLIRNWRRLIGFLFVAICLGACSVRQDAQDTTAVEPVPHKKFMISSGGFACNLRADGTDVQFEEQVEPDHERAIFRIPGGTFRSIERFRLGRHSITEWSSNELNDHRLTQTIKVYVARVLVPNFDLVETVDAFTYTLDGQVVRYIVLNVQQEEHSQLHAFSFFFTSEFFNVMHYTNALILEGTLLRRAMDEFYGQCSFADRISPTMAPPHANLDPGPPPMMPGASTPSSLPATTGTAKE